MGRGRHSYPKVKVQCACGWKGSRSTFMSRNKCPKCGGSVVQKPRTQTQAQREARFAADDAYCAEQIAKIDAEYKAKGYDKIMPIEEMGELVMKVFEPVLDAMDRMDPEEREKIIKENS